MMFWGVNIAWYVLTHACMLVVERVLVQGSCCITPYFLSVFNTTKLLLFSNIV